jgi:hypothetical protein
VASLDSLHFEIFENSSRTEALMRPAVWFLHRRSPASIALAPRAILFRLHHLPDDSRTKLGRRLRKKAAISKETESLRALPASSHPVAATLAAFPGIAKRFFHTASRLS